MCKKRTICLTTVINTLLFVPIIFLFTGCFAIGLAVNENARITKVDKLLSQINEIPDKDILFSTNDIIKKISPKPIQSSQKSTTNNSGTFLIIEGFARSKIDLSDPVLVYGDSTKYSTKYRSNFELYQFQAEENQEYSITIYTFQNQKPSFAKYFMYPIVYLLDANGNILDSNPISILFNDGIINSYCLNYKGFIKKSGNYFVLIGGDNRVSGQVFSHYSLVIRGGRYDYSGTSFDVKAVGYPIGTYNFTISLKKKL